MYNINPKTSMIFRDTVFECICYIVTDLPKCPDLQFLREWNKHRLFFKMGTKKYADMRFQKDSSL